MADQQEEDLSKLPVEERLGHKNWKGRQSAYAELYDLFRKTISEDDPAFTPYLRDPSILRAAIVDSNAVCQEKGIECCCSFIEYGGKAAAIKSREAFTSALVEKNVFGVTRAGTKKATTELCLLLIECEESADGVLEACTEGLKSKQPKAVAGAVATMKEIVRQFGAKTVNVKPILKVIPAIFGHADKGVRAEGTALVQELHRWLGAALDPHLADLKPVQIKELNESFVNEEKPEQTRFTRSQQREKARKEAEASLSGTAAFANRETGQAEEAEAEEEADAPDAFDFAEPANVLDKLSEGFYENLSSSKWKDRKELALDPLLETLKKFPRLQEGSYDELVRALAARMTDANIACVISAAGCLEHLAKGLRVSFGRYKTFVIPPVLERCKEKKASVTDALGSALDATFASLASISEITEDITTFSKHKNPQVKEQTYKWLVRSLSTTRVPPNIKIDLKPLTEALLHGFEDSFEPVRSAAAEGLGCLLKILGERAMGPTMENLDDIRKGKVKEFAEKAQVKCKAGAPAAAPSAAASKAVPSAAMARPAARPAPPKVVKPLPGLSSSGGDKENTPPTTSAPPTPKAAVRPAGAIRKPPVLSSASAAAKKPVPPAVKPAAAPPAAAKPSANEPIRYRFSQEDAEAQAESIIPTEIYSDLSNSNWKARLASIEALQTWLESDGSNTEAELVVRILSKKPGWKESNFQVYGKVAGVCQYLAEKSKSWTRACSALTIGPLSDKLGDIKIKKPAGDALTAYAEKFSLQFVLSHAYDPMTKQKAPKAQADSLLWVEQAIRDFGIQGLAIREMIEFLKTALKSSNALVRTNATKTLVTLRLYVGPDIKTFIQDLNPQLLSTIESDFDKVSGEAPPAPTRTSGDNAPAPSSAPASGGGGAAASRGGPDPLDDLFPRQDLDKLVPHAIVAGIGDANWKQRKESLEQVQGILEANKRLKPTMGELGGALKQRMADSNKMVQGLALDVISRIANGMNKPFEKHARLFIGPICPILADAKPNVRAPALSALSAIYENCGLDCMINGLSTGLEATNPVQRKELATWLGEKLQEGTTNADLAPLAAPIIACLEDKNAEVRKAAQAVLPFVIASAGYGHVMDQTSGLKPASRSTVIPMIEAAKSAAGAVPKASTPATAAVTALETGRPSSAASSDPPASASSASFPATKPPVRGFSALNRTLKPATSSSVASSRSITPNSAAGDQPSAPALAAKPSLVRKPLSSRQSLLPGAQPLSQPASTLAEAAELPIRSSDSRAKSARAARETGPLKWIIEGSARPDQVDFLHQQMIPHFSNELVSLLFSKDHHNDRDFIAGLSILEECTTNEGAAKYGISPEEMRASVLANADMILKYLTVRLADTATTMTIKCLEVTEALIAMMPLDNYQLVDYEASAFLPSLINKLGDGKEPIRSRVKAILHSVGTVYPLSKTFSALLEHGLSSKNARTRAESAEELSYLFKRQGLSVCQPSKALPIIAALISDKDASCRSAALAAIASAYSEVGEAVYKYIGALPDKEMTMLDEKLKRTAGGAGTTSPAPVRTASASGVATPKRPDSRQEQQARADSRNGVNVPGPSRLPATSGAAAGVKRRQSALPVPGGHLPISSTSQLRTSHLPQSQPTTTTAAKSRSASPEQALTAMSSKQRMVLDEAAPPGMMHRQNSFEPDSPFAGVLNPDPTSSVEALKVVQRQITEDTALLAGQADQLMSAITMQMGSAFEGLNADTPQATLRLCKHLMQTLSGFFDQKTLSLAVSREALIGLLAELTKRLLETAASEASEAISSLSKVLNMVLIRIFHNATRASTFGALFDILQTATADMRELGSADLAERAKYAELVMKCLWKVSKSVKETLEDRSLDSRHLLLYIDRFLTTIPPAEWRRRASDNIPLGDMPLRTIKTILQQVVAAFGDSVYEELSLIDRPENSFVYQYLFRLLNNSRTVSAEGPAAGGEMLSRQSSTISTASSALMGRKGSDNSGSGGVAGRQGNSRTHSATNGSTSSATGSGGVPQSPGRSADIEMNLALKAIFDKIGNAQESKKGIAELYEFQKQHPEAEARINTWITATGSFFQSYLKRALSNLAAEEAERASNSPPTGSLSPGSNRPGSAFAGQGSPYTSPPLNGTASPMGRDRGSRVPSAASANDDRLESLRQRFGMGARAVE